MATPPPPPHPRDAPLRTDEYAGWWQRLGGYILDGFIFAAAMFATWALLALVAYVTTPGVFEEFVYAVDADAGWETLSGGLQAWVVVFGLVTLALYVGWDVVWLRSRQMARPGQSIAGYRVVRVQGVDRLSTGRSIGRAVAKWLYSVQGIGFLLVIASAFTIGMSSRRQGLHDMIAGTACVRKSALERRGIGPDAVPVHAASPAPRVAAGSPPSPPSSGPFV